MLSASPALVPSDTKVEERFIPPTLFALTRLVAARHAGASRFTRNFVRGKLLTDPASNAIVRLAKERSGFGVLADLGCGHGQIGLALLLAGLADEVHGLDLDARKVSDATRAAHGLRAQYSVADLAEAPVPICDTAIILDVLLQMPEAAQYALLTRLASAVRRRVVIRAFDPDRGWRTRLAFVTEDVARRMRRDKTELRPLPTAALAAPLRKAGFSVSVVPCWGWTPLPNVMLLAER